MNVAIPALLFPALSLLLLAYTNRYLALAALIRKLHEDYSHSADMGIRQGIRAQIDSLYNRIGLICGMQMFGIISLLICLMSMASMSMSFEYCGYFLFLAALTSMGISLWLALKELRWSVDALQILLKGMTEPQYEKDDTEPELEIP